MNGKRHGDTEGQIDRCVDVPGTSAMFQRPALSFVHSTFIVFIPFTLPFPSSTNSYK